MRPEDKELTTMCKRLGSVKVDTAEGVTITYIYDWRNDRAWPKHLFTDEELIDNEKWKKAKLKK